MRPSLWLFIVFFLSCAVFAQTPTPSPTPAFSVQELKPGFRLSFPDGREAELHSSTTPTIKSSIPMLMTESLCSNVTVLAKCALGLPIRIAYDDFVWTKNPDAQKLGKPLMRLLPNGKIVDLFQNTPSMTLTLDSAQIYGVQTITDPTTLSCDNYDWLIAGTSDANHPIIETWQGDINSVNLETGLNENQTVGGAFHMQLEKQGDAYTIGKASYFSELNGQLPALLTIGPVTMVTTAADHSLCQSTFTQDISGLQALNQTTSSTKPTSFPDPYFDLSFSAYTTMMDYLQVYAVPDTADGNDPHGVIQ